MARPSKTNAFVTHNVQDASKRGSKGEGPPSMRSSEGMNAGLACHETIVHDDGVKPKLLMSREGEYRRGSKHSTISVLPESPSWDDDENLTHLLTNGPLIMRPSFIRPEVVQRMQMSSPPPLDLKDYAASYPPPVLGAHAHREYRSVSSTSSSSSGSNVDSLRYPLVLLHVTLLPLRLPWDSDVMRELLSPRTMSDISLLGSKLTKTILQRGILIPHPQEEYDLLEERLLEALGLKPERLSSNGHFRSPYTQQDCAPSVAKPPSISDSGLGSSGYSTPEELEMEDRECKTCQRDLSSDTRWDIKVYAANGMMRAAAWTAVWRDMERVDVEIMPRLSEETTQQLHDRQNMADIHREESLRDGGKTLTSTMSDTPCYDPPLTSASHTTMPTSNFDVNLSKPFPPRSLPREKVRPVHGLPQVYTPTQIPLFLLLKNYSLLLARKQDWKNIAIVFLVIASIMLALRPTTFIISPEHDLALFDLDTPGTVSVGWTSQLDGYQMAESLVDGYSLEHKDDERRDARSSTNIMPRAGATSTSTIQKSPAPTSHKDHNSSAEDAALRHTDVPQTRGSDLCPWQFPFTKGKDISQA